jgi:hypothetical protein
MSVAAFFDLLALQPLQPDDSLDRLITKHSLQEFWPLGELLFLTCACVVDYIKHANNTLTRSERGFVREESSRICISVGRDSS